MRNVFEKYVLHESLKFIYYRYLFIFDNLFPELTERSLVFCFSMNLTVLRQGIYYDRIIFITCIDFTLLC